MKEWSKATMQTALAVDFSMPLKSEESVLEASEPVENERIVPSLKGRKREKKPGFLALQPLKLNGVTDAQLLRSAKNGHCQQLLQKIKKRLEMGINQIPNDVIRYLLEGKKFSCLLYVMKLVPEKIEIDDELLNSEKSKKAYEKFKSKQSGIRVKDSDDEE